MAQGEKILLLDGEKSRREGIAKLLTEWGHRVAAERCPDTAWRLIEQYSHSFTVVITPANAPRGSGTDFLARIARSITPRPHLIALCVALHHYRRYLPDVIADFGGHCVSATWLCDHGTNYPHLRGVIENLKIRPILSVTDTKDH